MRSKPTDLGCRKRCRICLSRERVDAPTLEPQGMRSDAATYLIRRAPASFQIPPWISRGSGSPGGDRKARFWIRRGPALAQAARKTSYFLKRGRWAPQEDK